MQNISYNRIALVGGIGTLLIFPANIPLAWQAPPFAGSSDEVYVAYLANQANVLAMVLIVAFHGLTRLAFAAGLCGVLRQAEGAGATLTGLAFACVPIEVSIEMIGYTLLGTAARLAGRGADPVALGALATAARDLMSVHTIPLALFAVLSSIVILRTGVLPRWIGWLGLAAGVLYEISALQFVAPLRAPNTLATIAVFLFFTPWMIASGVVLFRRARAQPGRLRAQAQVIPA
jgi:hypothetical protein